MQLFDPNNPNEKKKIIAAAVLGIVAISFLGYLLLGGSSAKKPTTSTARATPAPPQPAGANATNKAVVTELTPDDLTNLQPIPGSWAVPAVQDPNRNIFAYYEPPPPPVKVIVPPTPTPTPVPPLTLTSLSPSSVYARTADFSLEVMGDKFTPAVHIIVDGRELPTRFINPQQLGTTVPAAIIANPGTRVVKVQNNDGKLYSLTAMLTVTPPPVPNYNYVGIIGRQRFNNDTAVLQKKGEKDLLNVQRGDVLEGRFRVSSISEKEVVLVDTNLKIRHTIAFTVETGINQPFRPSVRTSDEVP
ncbi:MAG: hypothetical protein DMF71_08375 [Acidobacteria bacterium]|nr:MAG: hypothetical protein DMF71_08375 [Acidobacteriota bacterium]